MDKNQHPEKAGVVTKTKTDEQQGEGTKSENKIEHTIGMTLWRTLICMFPFNKVDWSKNRNSIIKLEQTGEGSSKNPDFCQTFLMVDGPNSQLTSKIITSKHIDQYK